jgi:hypothetical protein
MSMATRPRARRPPRPAARRGCSSSSRAPSTRRRTTKGRLRGTSASRGTRAAWGRSSGRLRRAKETRRTLRASLWGRIVACYRLGAADRQDLRGSVALRLDVSAAGRVRGAHVTRVALPDRAVVACLRDAVTKVGLPRARGPSRVAMEIHVGPGDDPVAPHEGAVRPGPGVLDADRVRDAARAASPRLLACYEAALAYAPGLWGRLAARVRVAPSGAVTEAFEVETRFPDERVVRCVLRELRGATMPAPSGGDARIVVPLRFWTASS